MGFLLGLPLLSVERRQLCLSFLIYRTAPIAGWIGDIFARIFCDMDISV